MLVEFIIERFGKFSPNLFSDQAKDVAMQLNMPMPPRVGETIQACLNGEEAWSGRYAILKVLSVQYGERKGHDLDCDVGAICQCRVLDTWVRSQS